LLSRVGHLASVNLGAVGLTCMTADRREKQRSVFRLGLRTDSQADFKL
jgi:hypothetical protein